MGMLTLHACDLVRGMNVSPDPELAEPSGDQNRLSAVPASVQGL